MRADYKLSKPEDGSDFAAEQLAASDFVLETVERAWYRLDVDDQPELMRFNREKLADYIGAAYALQAHREFQQGIRLYCAHTLAKAVHFQPMAGELFIDICMGMCLPRGDVVDACIQKVSAAAERSSSTAGESVHALAESMLCKILTGNMGRAKQTGEKLLKACASREYPELLSRYFAGWGESAMAVIDRDRERFVLAMKAADGYWVKYLNKQLKRLNSDAPVAMGASAFVDFGRAALWAYTMDRHNAPPVELASLQFVDVAWMRKAG
jgi:hypothetical protein